MGIVYAFLELLSHSKHRFTDPKCHSRTHADILTHSHSGGIELTFNGTNLDVVQSPMLIVSDPDYVNATNVSQL